MIYVDNDSTYSQRIYIPKDEADPNSGVTGHTFSLQRKDYDISGNGAYRIHPDAGFDGISGGTIAVYVTAATGITPVHLDVTEDGIYVPTGDSVYTGVTVQVYDGAYQDGYNDGYASGYTDGYASGQTDGYNAGYASGQTDGYASGHTDGYQEGYASGHTDGYQEGSNSGYSSGYTDGYASGQSDGYQEGHTDGYDEGYAEGYSSGQTDGYQEGKQDGYSEGYASGSTDGYQQGYRVGYAAGYTSGHTDGFAEGYASGVTDGAAAQKALMTAETFTENGEYTREDGWSAVTISVHDGPYQEGYEDGIAYQKSLLGSLNVTANGFTVTSETGYSAVTTNLSMGTIMPRILSNGVYTYNPSDFNYQGFSGLEIEVEVPTSGASSVLTAITATTNGMYTPPTGIDGFSSVRVNVQLDTATTYNQGYSAGYISGSTDGYSSGYTEGVDWRDAQDIRGVFEANGTYHRSNGYGWNEVVVRVPTAATYNSGYTDGYSAGTDYQKGLLGSTALTTNGNYTNANGWSSVTVNVATSTTEYPVFDVTIETTAQNQTIRLMYNWSGYTSDMGITKVHNMDTDEYYVGTTAATIATPGVYHLRYYSPSMAPACTIVGRENRAVHFLDYCTSLDNISLSTTNNITGITFSPNTKIREIPIWFADHMNDFDGPMIDTLVIPNTVECLAPHCFDSVKVENIVIGSKVLYIGHMAFVGFPGTTTLSSITCLGKALSPVIEDNSLYQLPDYGTLYIPCGSLSAYSNWVAKLPAGWTVIEQGCTPTPVTVTAATEYPYSGFNPQLGEYFMFASKYADNKWYVPTSPVNVTAIGSEVTYNNGRITNIPSNALVFELIAVTGGYKLRMAGGTNRYLAVTGSSASLSLSTTGSVFTFTDTIYNGSGTAIGYSSSAAVMRYNNMMALTDCYNSGDTDPYYAREFMISTMSNSNKAFVAKLFKVTGRL